MSARDLSAQLTDHVAELGYWLTMVQVGRGDTAAALAEVDVLLRKLTALREQLTGQAVPVNEQHVALQALPRELVAEVEQAWEDLHQPPPHGMPSTEYWANTATRHDQMVTVLDQLFDSALGGGLLTQLTLDARQHHRDQAAQAWRDHRAQAERARVQHREQAELDSRPVPVRTTSAPAESTAVDTPADQRGREIAELLGVVWRLHEEGLLPAALDSLLLGEYHHLRPVQADRPDMLGDIRALADQVDW